MSWQSKVLGLCKKYGESAKFAATTILGVVVPGSPAVISLVEQAFDAAHKSGQDNWEINVVRQLETTADNQARLEQILDVLGGDLQHVFAQAAAFSHDEPLAKRMLALAEANDARWQESARKLDGIAHRFDRLEAMGNRLLDGQRQSHGILEEMLPLVRDFAAGTARSDATSRLATPSQGNERERLEREKATLQGPVKLEIVFHGHDSFGPYREDMLSYLPTPGRDTKVILDGKAMSGYMYLKKGFTLSADTFTGDHELIVVWHMTMINLIAGGTTALPGEARIRFTLDRRGSARLLLNCPSERHIVLDGLFYG